MGAFFFFMDAFYKEEKRMKKYECIKHAIFGFKDEETGEKLREFFKRHTGKDVDFNGIKHYQNGLKLLRLSIPLNSIGLISITEAAHRGSKDYIRFTSSIDTVINWYENEYLVLKDYEIIKHIPHSSLEFPESYKTDERDLARIITFGDDYMIQNYKMTDLFVDELFKNIEGVEAKAPYTRLYCDVEKYLNNDNEPMYKYGHGYEYTKGLNGKTFHRHFVVNGIDPDGDIIKYYKEHHKKLTLETRKILESGKKVLILDLHSFSDEQAISTGKSGPFPDICVGINDKNYDQKVLDLIINKIKKRGLTYQINYPYSGSIITNELTEEEMDNICSIMIEVNKRVYL